MQIKDLGGDMRKIEFANLESSNRDTIKILQKHSFLYGWNRK